ncbi:hypothetical protein CJ030_MR3G009481 [Morella rubra]|uniref:Endonuclease/exonuclease/phosphatase domain-containing protein n=1 Tax=Morella rubra TaxID=262757 RepID=A0A6A1W3K5_9ROSI|nr:hypothetical protein CJ030_MR3G009481 [Morella rubra]
MRLMFWNCRGLARPVASNSLRAMEQKYSPDIIFLSETKISSTTTLLAPFGFVNLVEWPANRRKGGVVLAWKNGVEIEVSRCSEHIISAIVSSDPPNTPWLLSGVYAPTERSQSVAFWESLEASVENYNGPWFCAVDFNSILSPDDKQGGRDFASSSVGALRLFMDHMGLIDLGSLGLQYTWTNCRQGMANIREKLDRGIANADWRGLFPRASVTNLPITSSDHSPLIIDSDGGSRALATPFRFEEFWVKEADCLKIVQDAWNTNCYGSLALRLCKKIRHLKVALRFWNRNRIGNLHSNIQRIQRELEFIQDQSATAQNGVLEANLRQALIEEQRKEELLWKSKSRVTWLTSSDLNTKFFHISTIVRRRRNAIEFLKTPTGSWLNSRPEIGKLFTDSFSKLFTSTRPVLPSDLEGLISPEITDEENLFLCQIPSEREIWDAVRQIGSRKAPGPDGLTALFYKQF